MSTALRNQLVTGLASHMRALSEDLARSFAHDLTCLVSSHVGNVPVQSARDLHPLTRLPCFPRETWNLHTLSVPWEAFRIAHGGGLRLENASEVRPLCSAPAQLDAILADQAAQSGLWGGSLLVALGKVFAEARHDLVILSPYWRVDGVRSLLSAAGRANYAGIKVRVFAPASRRMSSDDQLALKYFVDKMRKGGALVQVLTPRSIEGMAPFLHAKLIIADSVKAYVGSANFTSSGLDHGIEAGVLVNGEVAGAFALWVNAIETICAPVVTSVDMIEQGVHL